MLAFKLIYDNILQHLIYHPPNESSNIKYQNNIQLIQLNNIVFLEIYPSSIIDKNGQEIYKRNKIIIFSHGNACNIFTMTHFLQKLANELNILIIVYDYPNYGLTKGYISETNCSNILQIIIDYYQKFTKKILLVGQSLGTGVIITTIAKNNWKNPIILISPYKSIPRVIYDSFLVDLLYNEHRYDSINKISKLICPVKIFHGKQDNLISYRHSCHLFQLVQNKLLYPTYFEDADHINIIHKITKQHYLEILNQF